MLSLLPTALRRAPGLEHVGHAEGAAELLEVGRLDPEMPARKAIGLEVAADDPAVDRGPADVAALGDLAEAVMLIEGHGGTVYLEWLVLIASRCRKCINRVRRCNESL
jgi:hypothetical protein